MVAPGGSLDKEGQNAARQQGVRGAVWGTALRAPRREREEGEGAPGTLAEIPCSPPERPRWSRQSPCSPWRSLHWSRFILKDHSPWRTHAGGRENCEEEGAEERSCYEQTATFIPHPPVPRGVGRQRSWGWRIKIEPGESWGKVV